MTVLITAVHRRPPIAARDTGGSRVGDVARLVAERGQGLADVPEAVWQLRWSLLQLAGAVS